MPEFLGLCFLKRATVSGDIFTYKAGCGANTVKLLGIVCGTVGRAERSIPTPEQKEMMARICPIVKQIWLLPFLCCLYCFVIS